MNKNDINFKLPKISHSPKMKIHLTNKIKFNKNTRVNKSYDLKYQYIENKKLKVNNFLNIIKNKYNVSKKLYNKKNYY